MRLLKQSSTAQPLLFLMVQSSDHVTALTGASPTVTLSKAGAAFGAAAGAVTEIANGWYKCAGNATDTNTLGPLVLHATATNGDPVDIYYDIVAFDPQLATTLGLSAVPAVLTSAGLDNIATTAPAGVASTFREQLVAVWRSIFKKSTVNATQLKTYADDGSTVLTTQTVSDDGVTQTRGVSA